MTRAIKIEDLPSLDDTAIQVLRVISIKLGEKDEGFVDYKIIGDSIDVDRDVVSKAVKRLQRKRIISIKDKKMKILKTVFV